MKAQSRAKLQLLFDYGDDWRFRVKVIGLGEKVPRAWHRKMLKAVGKAPPQYPLVDETGE